MNFLKSNWKIILIIILTLLFLNKCASSGNYARKYQAQIEITNHNIDSLKKIQDSLNNKIISLEYQLNINNIKIESINSQLDLSKEQNKQLSNRKIYINPNQINK